MKTSDKVRERIKAAGGSFHANSNIAGFLEPGEREALQAEVEAAVGTLLDAMVIDRDNDHNSIETPRRVAKMFLREVFAGRYEEAPSVTEFPNVRSVDEIYTVGPIPIRSACSHHMVPILGDAWVGVIPGERLIGLSKFSRLTQWIMARPQIQEEAAAMLADELEAAFAPRALAVVIKARHFCCGWRGVKDGSEMVSSVMRGLFRENEPARNEFMSIIKGQGY
jgi:GTP cyclohydrolase I